MIEDSDTSQGGSKNGKKGGLSGSSFFTWFMVIALLGVWTSVAVVWFDLVDYEQVLGKLGIYDADGDGDFDVEDAKVLLGEEPGGVVKKKSKEKEVIQDEPKKVREKPVSSKKEARAQEKKKTKEGKEKDEPKVKRRATLGRGPKDASNVRKERLKEKQNQQHDGNAKEKAAPKRAGNTREKETTKRDENAKEKETLKRGENAKEKESTKKTSGKNSSEANQASITSTKSPSKLLEILRKKLARKEGL